ncbi:MAG: ComF family protein [Christensenellales bacterium]|jgi:competence protein ComFC
MKIFDKIVDLLLPPVICLGCEEPRKIDFGAPLCKKCEEELETLKLSEYVCLNCLSPLSSNSTCKYCQEGGMQNIYQAFAPYHYHGVARKLIIQLKFGFVDDAAIPLADAMYQCIYGMPFDAMVPVPLHKDRLRERGINQSERLSELISAQNGIPILKALEKIKKTKRQSSLNKKEKRESNVKGAYAICEDVEGLNLLLIDDVRTTGSTARACAKELASHGAKSVSLLTAAVAPPKEK